MDMDTNKLILRKTGAVAHIVLNNPVRLNAISKARMAGSNTHAARRCFRIRERISAAAAGMLVPGP
jgi:enoyl-CoA hydratase/carnithine racemase